MKKVLVTGGTQGVGLETVKLLLEQGYEVHITLLLNVFDENVAFVKVLIFSLFDVRCV